MNEATKKSNRIPRNFNRITGKINIKTNVSEAGDIMHIYKNYDGYTALNTRTGLYCQMFISLVRNAEIFTVTAID